MQIKVKILITLNLSGCESREEVNNDFKIHLCL